MAVNLSVSEHVPMEAVSNQRGFRNPPSSDDLAKELEPVLLGRPPTNPETVSTRGRKPQWKTQSAQAHIGSAPLTQSAAKSNPNDPSSSPSIPPDPNEDNDPDDSISTRSGTVASPNSSLQDITNLALSVLPQVYLLLLLRLPLFYFDKLRWIFERADLTLLELRMMALDDSEFQDLEPSALHTRYLRLKSNWDAFLDTLVREWQTLNIISGLLLSAIMTILQIPSAAGDPFPRYTALLSSICALISLLFGCLYITQFGSMRETYKMVEWAMELSRRNQSKWWNGAVLLAMPSVWAIWAIFLYIVSIMSFIWRSGPQNGNSSIIVSSRALLAIRLVITAFLTLGITYVLLALAMFRHYGLAMDRAWSRKLEQRVERSATTSADPSNHTSLPPLNIPPRSPNKTNPDKRHQSTSNLGQGDRRSSSILSPDSNIIGRVPSLRGNEHKMADLGQNRVQFRSSLESPLEKVSIEGNPDVEKALRSEDLSNFSVDKA